MRTGGLRSLPLLLAAATAPGTARADTTTAEVAALLDFCGANPGMSYSSTAICGSERVSGEYPNSGNPPQAYDVGAQWYEDAKLTLRFSEPLQPAQAQEQEGREFGPLG